MHPPPHAEKESPRSDVATLPGWMPWLVAVLSLGILGATILVARVAVRDGVRAQIIARDGEILHAVALMPDTGDLASAEPGDSIRDPATQLTLMLRTSRLRGVLAARLFDTEGREIQSFPANVRPADLPPGDLPLLRTLRPVCRFHPAIPLEQVVWAGDPTPSPTSHPLPLLEVVIPLHDLHQGTLAGVGQFLIEGGSVEREFARLDASLNLQAALGFLVAGSLLGGVVGLGFRRLRKSHRLLEQRTADLLQANQELIQTAKTSAVGAVTSHLVHELKNPLAGVHNLMVACATDPRAVEASAGEWREAAAATRRMQSVIAEIVALLREDQDSVHYQLSLQDLGGLVMHRLREGAGTRGVALEAAVSGSRTLNNRTGNLAALILVNLGQNALQATSVGGRISLEIREVAHGIECDMKDDGTGVPADLAPRLFHPVASRHAGGSGLGLSICKQLANHLGATLELVESSPSGSTFRLTLPLSAL